ncbi:MAG: hypothetical protein ACOCUW_04730, partial [Gemmatimonadota bacterium]
MNRRTREEDRRYGRALLWGLTLSIVVHVVLFLVFSGRPLPTPPFSAAGERMGDTRAAPGGGMQAEQLQPPTPALSTPPPIPVP